MPNVFTRVPDTPPPALPPVAAAVVPVADLFMVLMWSRPSSGSLRQTWVTPATLWLTIFVTLSMVAGILLAFANTTGVTQIGVVIAVLALLAGSGSVAIVGMAQRLAR